MQNLIKDNFQKYYKLIMDNLEEYSYREKRYGVEYSLTLWLSDNNVNFKDFIDHKRKTDMFIELEKNLCCIILDSTTSQNAIKATSNLQTAFQNKNFGKKLYTSVVFSEDYENNENMIKDLFYVLEYSISNNMDNIVIDKSQMLLQNR
ncbi:hypothetical protein [Sulfurimonas sp.]|uniref:hypothetical protein n=1 Tax=Sulfurimonas sp. TaxID=2022749 RepID=UPI00262C9002|nr:hypothetical protein [Sulfurimonas sp.]MCW8896133.1 hypothetical protein [Sulfurimonas sp.]